MRPDALDRIARKVVVLKWMVGLSLALSVINLALVWSLAWSL